jgi:hypothetical protein
MPKITEMFAYVMADKDEDDEGVIGFYSPQAGGWIPMVGADVDRVKSLKKEADRISAQVGKPYKILKFKLVEEIEIG